MYGTVLSKFDGPGQNPYELSDETRCFLLKRLLEEDFDYLTTLTGLFLTKYVSFTDFKRNLAIHFKRASTDGVSAREMRLLREMEQEWKSPKEYFRQHILAPRRGWLLDLELVHWDEFRTRSQIDFKVSTKRLIEKLEELRRSELFKYLANSYYEDFARLLGSKTEFTLFSHLSEGEKKEKTIDYLKIAFSIFGTVFLKRISSRSFFEYIPCHALSKEMVICPRKDLEEVLLTISASTEEHFRYRRVEEISEEGKKIDVGYITAET